MKKGLLSILAGALVLVGCQNYDDQFDNLESQISALASTVAGLSQVQSDLASLAGTVSSLASTVNGLGSQIDTAVADGLSDIQADIDAIEAAVADVASSEEVTALQESVDASQEDLDELLANSSIFTGDVIINSQNTLDVFHAMGSTLAIVNGEVDIDVSESMDLAKVQEVVDQILNVTEDFAYTAGAGVDTEVTFSNLTGTRSLTLDQKGGYMLENLMSATVVTLDDDATVDIVHLGSLETVTSINGGNIHFAKATELHLTSLPRYGATLSLQVDRGGVIDMTALRDVDASGEQSALALSIEGPSSITIDQLDGEGGSITLTDVATAVVNSYDGTVTVADDVISFTSDGLYDFTISGADIETLDITGKLNPNDEDDEEGPLVDLSSKGDLDSVTVSGAIASVDLDGNNNLTTVVIDATVSGAAGIVLNNNSDLTSVDVSGASAALIHVTSNGDLEELTIDATIIASSADDAVVDGNVKVASNESLTSLTIASSPIETLNITSNTDLETIDLSGVTAIGATGEASVTIKDNNLTASVADNKADGADDDDDVDDGAAGDLGSFTTSSGMETAKDYLTAVAADADSTAEVLLDEVSSVLDNEGDTTSETSDVADYIVLKLVAAVDEVVEDANDAILETVAWILPSASGTGLSIQLDGIDVLHDGSAFGTVTTSGNLNVDLAVLKSQLAIDRAALLDATLDVYKGVPNDMPTVTFKTSVSSASNGEYYTDASAPVAATDIYLTSYDKVKLTIGDTSATATITTATASGATAAAGIADALTAAWQAKYATGVSGALSFWNSGTQVAANAVIEAFELKSDNSGSRAYGDGLSIAWTKATAAQASEASNGAVTQTYLDWTIGATDATSDNTPTAKNLILQLVATADNDNFDNNQLTGGTTLTTTLKTAAGATDTDTSASVYSADARGDVVNAEGAREGTVTTEAEDAVSISRIGWLAD